jgi:uncharacterized glyoxalase superfamily protein PhnB
VNIPEGYQQLMPYLIVDGAINFLRFMVDVFGATEKMKHMRDEHVVMHAEVLVGNCVMMVADTTKEYGACTGAFFVYLTDADAVYAKAIAAGAIPVMPMSDQPYGRSGGVKDAWGNTWWITTAK